MSFFVVDVARSAPYLRLDGPFAYPAWVFTLETATPMSKRAALAWAEAVRPHEGSESLMIMAYKTTKAPAAEAVGA